MAYRNHDNIVYLRVASLVHPAIRDRHGCVPAATQKQLLMCTHKMPKDKGREEKRRDDVIAA